MLPSLNSHLRLTMCY